VVFYTLLHFAEMSKIHNNTKKQYSDILRFCAKYQKVGGEKYKKAYRNHPIK
jgi:hypothetical protein